MGPDELEQLIIEKANRVSQLAAQRGGMGSLSTDAGAIGVEPTALEESALVPSIEAFPPSEASPLEPALPPGEEPLSGAGLMEADVVEAASARLVESNLMSAATNSVTPEMKAAVQTVVDRAFPGMLDLNNEMDLREAINGIADGTIPIDGPSPGAGGPVPGGPVPGGPDLGPGAPGLIPGI